MSNVTKVGIISCSGEEIPAGTISRLATRRVLEHLRPQSTVTLCLPLFLAGEAGERRFAQQHPTVTVDGCDKLCAKRGTEAYSGPVAASLVVTDILGERLNGCHRSVRALGKADEEAAEIVAQRIVDEIDGLGVTTPEAEHVAKAEPGSCSCSCGSPPAATNLKLNGKTVTVDGLPIIFDHLRRQGLEPDGQSGERLLETVRVYHRIEADEEGPYRAALVAAYREYCRD